MIGHTGWPVAHRPRQPWGSTRLGIRIHFQQNLWTHPYNFSVSRIVRQPDQRIGLYPLLTCDYSNYMYYSSRPPFKIQWPVIIEQFYLFYSCNICMSTLYIFCTYYMAMMKERRNNKTEVNLPWKYPKLQHTQRLHTSIHVLKVLDAWINTALW